MSAVAPSQEPIMADTISIQLNGDVPLREFAEAIQHFQDLVINLTHEVVGEDSIQWHIYHLEAGSAFAEVRGLAEVSEDVARVVQAYQVVGNALANDLPIPYTVYILLQRDKDIMRYWGYFYQNPH